MEWRISFIETILFLLLMMSCWCSPGIRLRIILLWSRLSCTLLIIWMVRMISRTYLHLWISIRQLLLIWHLKPIIKHIVTMMLTNIQRWSLLVLNHIMLVIQLTIWMMLVINLRRMMLIISFFISCLKSFHSFIVLNILLQILSWISSF